LLQEVKDTMKEMDCPTKKIWITELSYGLLGDPISSPDKQAQLVTDTYKYAGGRFLFWYAFARPDLNAGFVIDHNTSAWESIKRNGK
jgi:hypothetical protein